MLVAASGDGGGLDSEDSRRLQRALALRRRTARQLMTPRTQVQALDADRPSEQLARAALEGPYTRYPVYRGARENLVGILHSRDLAARVLRGEPLEPLESLLRPVVAVPEGLPSDRLLAIMRRERALLVVVVDEFGGVAGIVSSSDLLRDVLGAVPEDFGGAPVAVEETPDGRLRLPGRLPVDHASRATGVPWPQEAGTVAGAVLAALGHLPSPGERLRIGEIEVEVERFENRAVVSVLVAPRRETGDG